MFLFFSQGTLRILIPVREHVYVERRQCILLNNSNQTLVCQDSTGDLVKVQILFQSVWNGDADSTFAAIFQGLLRVFLDKEQFAYQENQI